MKLSEKIKLYLIAYKANSRLYTRNWKDYRALYVWSTMITVTVLLSVFYYAAQQLLELADIPCLTTATFPQLLEHPLCAFGFLLLAFLIFYACWFQYCVILMGMRSIRSDSYSLLSTMKEAAGKTLRTPPLTILVFFFYLMLFLPACGAMFPTDLLSYFTIPDYVTDFFLNHLATLFPFSAAVAVLCWLTMKFYYVLPLSILKDVPIGKAFGESSRLMKGKKASTFLVLCLLLIIFGLVEFLFLLPLSALQYLADCFFSDASVYVCLFALAALKIFSAFYLIRVSTILFTTTYPDEFFAGQQTDESLENRNERKEKNRLFALASNIFTVLTAFTSAFIFLLGFSQNTPLVISYEGLDANNGVPNSIEVLARTVESAHPDYIEIDIQETADGQFAVISAEGFLDNYGHSDSAGSYTLAELTAMSGTAGEYTASICSLDTYLQAAEKLGQKLILVLNSGSEHPETMVQNFLKRYGEQILEAGYPIESMDYRAVCEVVRINQEKEEAKAAASRYTVNFIVNVPLLYPDLDVDGLNVEKTNLRQSFVTEARQHDQALYVWMIDKQKDMSTMVLMNVDGIVTCYPSAAKEVITSITGSGYLQVLWKYILKLI